MPESSEANSGRAKTYQHRLSSWIKNIYIELHGYSFFHGPSEVNKVDNRFIGRSKITNKLKAILTHNETRSGAYLVTGYRGMGKSSFVSKVIDEVDPSKRRAIGWSIYWRVLTILFLLSFLDLKQDILWNFGITPVLILIAGFYLVLTDKYKYDLGKASDMKKVEGCSLLYRIFKTLIVSKTVDSERVFRGYVQVVYLTLFLHFFGFQIFNKLYDSLIFTVPFFGYFLGWVILIIVNIVSHYCEMRKKKTAERNGTQLWTRIKKYFNYSKRIYVRINLGYEKVREIDILRLIARNIQEKFNSPRQKSLMEILYKFAVFSLLYIFVGALYYSEPVYKLNDGFKKQMKISEYLPSQTKDFLSTTGKNDIDRIKKKLENKEDKWLKKLVISADIFVYGLYRKVYKFVNLKIDLSGLFAFKNTDFRFLPKNLDYLFILHFLAFFLAWRNLVPKIFGLPTHRELKKKIKELNEIVDYEVTDEAGGGAGVQSTAAKLNFSRKRTRKQPRADIREIEKNLISILESFNRYSRFSMKPEFVFIFDELDKIEPGRKVNVNIQEKEEELYLDQPETTYFSTEGTRQRQHTIFRILSNLKHFLTTAKAKFIFIAGREMYDAALADVSDRNFFIGSIFHDVIYVPSFFDDSAEEKKTTDVLHMTERYVCQFLFPPGCPETGEKDLKSYRDYLEKTIRGGENDWEKQQKIQKIIITLKHFITFLAYRSNGAPKKLTFQFEQYLYKPEENYNTDFDFFNDPGSLKVGFNKGNLYLRFNYEDQYTFGMITYLVNPVMLSIGRTFKHFADKLMVSSSFLVDHLYKFHKNAFAWRTIELTPEVLDINKSPQLRDLISTIISTLSNSHLKKIVNGLYDYKFRKRISDELSFLSKISENEAAAFNFSLDESLSLKKHFKKMLMDIQKKYRDDARVGNRPDFINSISFIHMILGDFHYYDEEYNDAIIEYMEAAQYLREVKFGPHNASLFILLVRNWLKLGLSLEKRKSHTSAYMMYSQLTSIMINFKHVNFSKFDLKEVIWNETKRDFCENDFRFPPKKNPFEMRNDKKSIRVMVKERYPHDRGNLNFESIQKGDDIVCMSEDFTSLLTDDKYPFSPFKSDLLSKLSYFERLKLVYQPLLAKLQITEKTHVSGITLADLKQVEREFDFFTQSIKNEEKFLFTAEFWVRIGNILYFKNGALPGEETREGVKCIAACNGCNNSVKYSCGSSHSSKNHKPCTACRYYSKSLELMVRYFLKIQYSGGLISNKFLLIRIFYRLDKNDWLITSNSYAMKVMANTLSCLGDTFYACVPEGCCPGQRFLKVFLKFILNSSKENVKEVFCKPFSKMESTLIYYYLSYRFYLKAGQHKDAADQLLKILYWFRNLVFSEKCTKLTNAGAILDDLKKGVLQKAIKILYRAYGNIHRLESKDFENIIFNNPEKTSKLTNISLNADIRELVGVFIETKLIWGQKGYMECPKMEELLEYNFATPYAVVNRMYNRVIDLRLKAKINYILFQSFGIENFLLILKILRGVEFVKIKVSVVKEFLDKLILLLEDYRSKLSDKSYPKKMQGESIFKIVADQIAKLAQRDHVRENIKGDILSCLKVSSGIDMKYSVETGSTSMSEHEEYYRMEEILSALNPLFICSCRSDEFYLNISKLFEAMLRMRLSLENKIKNLKFISRLTDMEDFDFISDNTKFNTNNWFEWWEMLRISDIHDNKPKTELLKFIKILNCIESANINRKKRIKANHESNRENKKTISGERFVEIFEFLITDSIYCLHEVIRLKNIYGTSYMGNFPGLAYAHKYMAKWCEFYHIYIGFCREERKKELIKDLGEMIGKENVPSLSPEYHYEKSREAFYSLKELHSEGKAYKEFIQKMFYLNDDFNDTIYHFFTAGERYLINSGNIDKALDAVRKKVKKSSRYEFDNYLEESI